MDKREAYELANEDGLFGVAHLIDLLRNDEVCEADSFLESCSDAVVTGLLALMYFGREIDFGESMNADLLEGMFGCAEKHFKSKSHRINQIMSKRHKLVCSWIIGAVKACDSLGIDIKSRFSV